VRWRSAFLNPPSGLALASRVRWETCVDLVAEGFDPVLADELLSLVAMRGRLSRAGRPVGRPCEVA